MYIIMIFLDTVPVIDSPSHNTAQQPPVQQGNAWYMYGTCSLMHV